MPVVSCPIEGCTYATPDVEAVVVAALLTTHSTVHTSASRTSKDGKCRRPIITANGTSEDWVYFKSRWEEFSAYLNLTTDKEKVVQLLECCDEPLRKDVTRSTGGKLTDKPFAEVLEAIRKLAVQEENVMVARVLLHNMQQDRGESIRSFGARIRGQANICKYTVTCNGCHQDVSYVEEVLHDVLASPWNRRLRNPIRNSWR